ncbi:MAG: hypothetical protein QOC64_1399 [Solirubrobacteraceae bacterium]|nr:hypothetical protein [Solirubrobacteraceae bacterium]
MIAVEPGQTVLLRPVGGGALAARVDCIDAGGVVLALLTPPMHPPVTGGRADLEITSRRGIVKVPVEVAGQDGRGGVRIVAQADGAETIQRRDFVRVEAVVNVVVRGGGPDGPAHDAFTLNVSGGGLLLTGVEALKAGDSAWVAIDLEDGTPPVEAMVTVVREEPKGVRGVQIASVTGRDEQRLVRFAYTREQRARIARDG